MHHVTSIRLAPHSLSQCDRRSVEPTLGGWIWIRASRVRRGCRPGPPSLVKPSARTPPKPARNTSPSPPPPPSLRSPSPSPPRSKMASPRPTSPASTPACSACAGPPAPSAYSTGFSFRGPDPHPAILALVSAPGVTTGAYSVLREGHFADLTKTLGVFTLDLGQKADLGTETRDLYEVDTGNPYVEWLMFNYGCYLLAGSARGDLPTNLQGKWALDIASPWSGDYHSNINIQMNYWSTEMSNLDVTASLFTYLKMNIFGHISMKVFDNSAKWANYPESAVWMGVASFHLDKLIPDLRFNDGTLFVSPCNLPEQPLITLGCAHAQQLIRQLFNAIEKGFTALGDTDAVFLDGTVFLPLQNI
ncbi:hypothetical protein B0H19DRAFT_1252627 [Mycena capillaripes]|nr:hypothetical protein B0H19DRAFT_1252627 [Mycena capillaripes]